MAKAVEEAIFRTECHRGTKDGDVEILRLAHRLLALSLAALIFGGSPHIGAERAHVQEAPHPGCAAGGDDGLRQLSMRALEVAVQDADQVDDRVLAAHEALEHRRIEGIGLHDVDRRQQDQVLGTLAAPRRHRDPHFTSGELRDEMAADEA